MLTQHRNEKHNVQAWYFEPIFPNNTTTASKVLEWVLTPKPFMGAYVVETKTGYELVPAYNVTSTGGKFITESNIEFSDKGKIAFSRIQPDISEASRIVKEGIEKTDRASGEELGNRFNTRKQSTVITYG